MKIAVASDHAGFDLKSKIVAFLEEKGIAYRDFGSGPGQTVDYVDYGVMAMDSVVSGECDRAILFCGTGIGMAVVANKYKGIRATPCWNPFTAQVSRSHNDSNCLTLGGRTLSFEEAVEIVRTWLETPFEGGRHQRRVAKILEVERKNFKP
ncbi:MAG: ribose 5-phosphate isomerase B [Candidatus Aminicenantes bacterium RBG_19FT_COMBO_58_17]|jgi:ribose 5-phosphate isomerase B|nr:MAG: ribose 5-phosphate isomerase B [Candidatus Aminicenantes bacterium RBG_19FT_COMBO_58_17]HCS47650.1 ribose 5-phosphate isomerase B [Candidatus Aminicenantes bacterium]